METKVVTVVHAKVNLAYNRIWENLVEFSKDNKEPNEIRREPNVLYKIIRLKFYSYNLQLACQAPNVSDTKELFRTFTMRVFIRFDSRHSGSAQQYSVFSLESKLSKSGFRCRVQCELLFSL